MSTVKNLLPIDFSTGVRSEKIQYNFEALESQIANDRISTFGHGITEGLDICSCKVCHWVPAFSSVRYQG